MTKQRARLGWGTILTCCTLTGIGISFVWAQQGDEAAVETLLPANAILYVGLDGTAAHRESWEKTAAYEALYKTGLMDVLEKAVVSLGRASGAGQFDAAEQAYKLISDNGCSFTVSLPADPGPPLPQLTVVLHKAASLEPSFSAAIQQIAENEMVINSRDVSGRKVTGGIIPNSPGVEVGWWTEGGHLMLTVGINAVESAIAVAEGTAENITTNRLWEKTHSGNVEFELSSISWLDFRALREKFGAMPIPEQQFDINKVLETLGLDNLGAVICQSGYKGRALWSEGLLEAPGERKGLLALADQQPITMDDLPPLPFATSGFYACSLDWSRLYDGIVQVIRDAAKLGPPDAAAQVEGALASLPQMLGFDLKSDLFDALGNVTTVYGDTRQGMFGMGFAVAVQVKDAERLSTTMNRIATMLEMQVPPGQLEILYSEKQGRDITTLSAAEGAFNPSFTVDKDWMVFGVFPQAVEAFLMRLDDKLTRWKPSPSYQQGLAALPQQFTSISASDPRKTYRAIVGLAPVVLPAIQAAMRQSPLGRSGILLPLSAADLPPAEAVGRPLFPNLSVCTSDDAGIHWTSRSSLPAVPLLGSAGGGTSIGAAAVLTALLLPAVQQARSAARRTQSRNNLKQIALAVHNYHDVHGNMPQGTHPNETLKPDERLSWLADILPQLDQAFVHQQIDFGKSWNDDANADTLSIPIAIFQNPGTAEADAQDFATTHYIGIGGLGEDGPTLPITDKKAGIFGYDRVARFRDIIDGTSNTLMTSEASKDFGPWGAGGKATVRAFVKKPYINGPDGIGGPYPGGCSMGMADGSVRFISENIDPSVLEKLATMAGGEVIDGF
jgi:hypothetical protein